MIFTCILQMKDEPLDKSSPLTDMVNYSVEKVMT